MLHTQVLHPSDLSDSDAGQWSDMQAATPAFATPLVGPQFARAVGEVRGDARVAIFRRGRRTVGYLAHHRRPTGFARPIGAPFSDYHALVTAPGETLDAGEALRGAGLGAFRFSGLIDPAGLFDDSVRERTTGFRIVLNTRPEDYLDALAAGSRNRGQNFRRYSAKLRRELGDPRIVASHDQTTFDALLDWKREQIRRTGVQDFLGTDWAQALLQRLFDTREGNFQGFTISLFAGSTHLCSHFGVRLDDHFHPWIGASNPDFRLHSLGLVHQWMAIEAMPSLGLTTYDLGPGFAHWKSLFAEGGVSVGAGLATTPTLGGRVAGTVDDLWALPAVSAIPAVGRLRRRMDQIALTRLTLGGRIQSLMEAFGAYDRRVATRRS
ncbi:MAG TPA: GNAT family N-acetyltransferase [Caulobacteraceae bacterium]|nr:GNAT family N-acetyltransferase [Caulobacteraceae bacterium]